MAITTLAGVKGGICPSQYFAKSGLATGNGQIESAWFGGGLPTAGVANTTISGGLALSSSSAQVTGQIPFFDPASGNSYLANFGAAFGNLTNVQGGLLLLCDRLWECGYNDTTSAAFDATSTSLQTITSCAAWPPRDKSGSSNGVGVYIALEISSSITAQPTFTLTYTNSANVLGRVVTQVMAPLGNYIKNQFVIFSLVAGDLGVKSVQSIQGNAAGAGGQWVLVAFRVLAMMDIKSTGRGTSKIDAITGGFAKVPNGAVPFFLYLMLPGGANGTICGSVNFAQG